MKLIIARAALIDAVKYNNFEKAREIMQEDIAIQKIKISATKRNWLHLAVGVGSLKEDPVEKKDEFGKKWLEFFLEFFSTREDATKSINQADAKGCTPLHLAAQNGYKACIEVLIDKGAEVNCSNRQKLTPLHRAVKNDHSQCVEVLIAKGATVNAQDKEGSTPLHLAAKKGNIELMEILISNGAIVDVEDNQGCTPLNIHIAAQRGRIQGLEVLIGKGAKVDTKDNQGRTPLHAAAEKGEIELIESLIGKGAKVDIKDNQGRTPLHAAAEKGHSQCVEVLIANGAIVDVKDNQGRTPIDLSSQNGHGGFKLNLLKSVSTPNGAIGSYLPTPTGNIPPVPISLKRPRSVTPDSTLLVKRNRSSTEGRVAETSNVPIGVLTFFSQASRLLNIANPGSYIQTESSENNNLIKSDPESEDLTCSDEPNDVEDSDDIILGEECLTLRL